MSNYISFNIPKVHIGRLYVEVISCYLWKPMGGLFYRKSISYIKLCIVLLQMGLWSGKNYWRFSTQRKLIKGFPDDKDLHEVFHMRKLIRNRLNRKEYFIPHKALKLGNISMDGMTIMWTFSNFLQIWCALTHFLFCAKNK